MGRKESNQTNKKHTVFLNELWHEISNNVVCATSKGQIRLGISDRAFASHLNMYFMNVKLLTERHLEAAHVKMPHCLKSPVAA